MCDAMGSFSKSVKIGFKQDTHPVVFLKDDSSKQYLKFELTTTYKPHTFCLAGILGRPEGAGWNKSIPGCVERERTSQVLDASWREAITCGTWYSSILKAPLSFINFSCIDTTERLGRLTNCREDEMLTKHCIQQVLEFAIEQNPDEAPYHGHGLPQTLEPSVMEQPERGAVGLSLALRQSLTFAGFRRLSNEDQCEVVASGIVWHPTGHVLAINDLGWSAIYQAGGMELMGSFAILECVEIVES
jgi:hypothetical protein